MVTNNPQEDKTFFVFPNPAKDKLNLKVYGKALISISDKLGKILILKVINQTDVIDVSALPVGLYHLKNIATGYTQNIVITK